MGRRLGVVGATGAVVSACLLAGATLNGCGGTSSTVTSPTAGPSTAPLSSSTTPTTTVPTTKPPGAAADLAAYFAAAADLDQRLRAAAVAANGAIGTAWISVTQSTLDAIAAADPTPAAHGIPAGLTPDVLLAVLTVQSDLVSRWYAFRGFSHGVAITPGSIPRSAPGPGGSLSDADYLLACLGNGGQAAASFAADLTAARAAAAHAPPVVPVDPGSQAAGELAVRLQNILGRNSGCMECGGARVTSLTPITWHHVAPLTPEGHPWDGDMGGLLFTARYTPGRGWSVQFNAC